APRSCRRGRAREDAIASRRHQHLSGLWDRGWAAWPALELALEAFERHLEARLADTPPEQWARLFAEDLYLSAACLDGCPGAAAAFTTTHVGALTAFALRRGGLSAEAAA